MQLKNKSILEKLRCPHCMSNKIEVIESKDNTNTIECLDCGKKTTFIDEKEIKYFTCNECNGTHFNKNDKNLECLTCGKVHNNKL